MIKAIKALKWLVQNKEKLEKLLKVEKSKSSNKNYDLSGVPAFQLDYINDILGTDKNK